MLLAAPLAQCAVDLRSDATHTTEAAVGAPRSCTPLRALLALLALLGLAFCARDACQRGLLRARRLQLRAAAGGLPYDVLCIPGRADPGCYSAFAPLQCSGGDVDAAPARRRDPRFDVTVVTQLSVDRLPRLVALTAAWRGPVSAAVFVPGPPAKLAAGVAALCALQLPARVELHLLAGAAPEQPYPINLLRQVSVDRARGDLVLILDVDFLPTPGLHDALLRAPEYKHVWANAAQRHLFVLPAFQMNVPACRAAADDGGAAARAWHSGACVLQPRTKSDVVAGLRSGALDVFHPAFAGAHNATDSRRWAGASAPYYVLPGPGYEPYVLGNRSAPGFPAFDARFTDRNRNKALFAAAAAARGFRFVVLPQPFVFHAWQSVAEEVAGRRAPMPGYAELFQEALAAELQAPHTCVPCHALPPRLLPRLTWHPQERAASGRV